MVTADNRFLRIVPAGLPLPLDNVIIDLFTGKFAESGQPVYQNDVVQIATPNEFGSALLDRGVVRYDIEGMCFIIISEMMKGKTERVPTKIVSVIGQNHD